MQLCVNNVRAHSTSLELKFVLLLSCKIGLKHVRWKAEVLLRPQKCPPTPLQGLTLHCSRNVIPYVIVQRYSGAECSKSEVESQTLFRRGAGGVLIRLFWSAFLICLFFLMHSPLVFLRTLTGLNRKQNCSCQVAQLQKHEVFYVGCGVKDAIVLPLQPDSETVLPV